MNAVEQYEANNVYFPMNLDNCSNLAGLLFSTINTSIYKTKIDWGDGSTTEGTTNSSKIFSPSFTGKMKIYGNRLKINNIRFSLGISSYTNDFPTGSIKNIELTPIILDFFPNTEYLYFLHYCYGNTDSNVFKGKVTGEWAVKCGSKLKNLELTACDYPNSNSTFNFDLIPIDSVLEVLKLGDNYTSGSSTVIVSGNISNLPST
ncbi:hypothetical protein [Epilithonimonas mollis]|uniref:Uncharacterized protein n=1 Tax=Epilithonimonas mollis TaxID=216903 RepID=A0A1M6R6U6_9FLAO|nr:hypothetical protein [Epilithonimonas mollis]SHK28174.1 hypothetical protein SAMN05444371_1715 [Epilithonimonas mollis]